MKARVTDARVDMAALAGVPIFRELSATELAAIVEAGRLQRVKAGAELVRQGAAARWFYVVMRGRLKVGRMAADGRESAVRFLGPGQMVGGPALFGGEAYPVTACAAEGSVVMCWSAGAISALVGKYPRLARNVMRVMARRIVELQNRCQELATEQVEQRLARALLRLAEQAGAGGAEAGVLLRVSRQDLSEMAGTTLFTVSRWLSRWAREGLVAAGRQKLVLRRPAALRAIAEAWEEGAEE